MKLTFWEIATAVKATNDWKKWQDFEIDTIEFDSRVKKNGMLFVPLQGENDGHKFVGNAIQNGAEAAFWHSKKVPPKEFPILEVADTLKAMQDLAVYYLKKIAPKVIAITGSNGKTTTKDMTEAVLAQAYYTYKTQGNYNNEIGLPYTILHMPEVTEILILEMGMDHANEITFLSELARPDAAAITMIGEAHIENLGSRKRIAQAKMEIADGLEKNGLLLLPADEPLLVPCSEVLPQTIQTFGLGHGEYQADSIVVSKEKTTFKLKGIELDFMIPVPGKYNVTNALIAIAMGRWFNVSDQAIKTGLATFKLTKNRTEWLISKSGLTILSDVYNANPTAMKLVLESFSQMPVEGKRVAVLGDMLELGNDSKAMHASVSEYLSPETVNDVFLYGNDMQALWLKLKKKYNDKQLYYFEIHEKEQLIFKLQSLLKSEDMVVLKASNGMGFNEIVDALIEC